MRQGLLDGSTLRQMVYDALDASDDLILVLEHVGERDEDLLIAAGNEAFFRVSGLSSESLIGTPFIALAIDPGAKACRAIVAASREHLSFRSDMLCRRSEGVPFWLGLHLMPVPDSTPPCSVVLGRDISKQRRDRRQHSAIQNLLAKVFVTVQTPVAIVDEQGAVVMNNPALDCLLDTIPGSLNGKSAIGFVAPDCRGAVIRLREPQIKAGENYRIRTRVLRADGRSIPVELISTIVESDDLKRCRIVTVMPMSEPGVPMQSAAPQPMKTLVAGRIKLIGLDDVKTALGDRWPVVADRVLRSAEHIITRRCGPHDTWCRTKDSTFIVCFANATQNEAAFRAAAIAREIRNRLIGEGETPATAYTSAITTTIAVPDLPGAAPDALGEMIYQTLNGSLAEIESRARSTLARVVRDASCVISPVHAGALGKVVADFASLPQELEHQVRCALVALPMREAQEFDFDRLILATSAQQILTKLAGGGLRTMFVPVSFEMFHDRRTMDRYLAVCRTLDERLRKHLVLTLTDLPQGVPRNRILDCALRLRPLCRGVGYQANNLELPPVEFSLLAGSVVVVHEADLRQWSLDDLVNLEKLIGVVHAHRGRTLVWQVSSKAKAIRLLKLGVDMVSLNDRCDIN